ncbi:hypothetical protein Cgig2_002698 [Carnegiea gigantea]|uniref:Uncharacterized protein n=1 Tax=Carnegiea gigantea TaxID=171969 RepID=A0A9Q1QL68_9CARY|nr:hypothetical protein Cgig2_002698 [Carnegiea gigantea]
MKLRVPGLVIGGPPEVCWTLDLCAGGGLSVFRSLLWVDRQFLSAPVRFVATFRSPATFSVTGISPEFPHLSFSGPDSAVFSLGAAVLSIQSPNRRIRAGKDGLKKFRRDSDSRKVRRRPETATELAGDDRNFRRTQHLDRQIPAPSSNAQILRKPKGNPSNPKPTTGEGAAGGSQRPKVHRTSGNPPMTTPGTLNFTGHLLSSRPIFPTQRRGRKEVGARTRRGGFWVVH